MKPRILGRGITDRFSLGSFVRTAAISGPADRRITRLGLITSLARQIGGEVEQDSSERGTTVSVTFPVIT
jgi:hypothetical protein